MSARAVIEQAINETNVDVQAVVPALRKADGTLLPGKKGQIHQDIYTDQGQVEGNLLRMEEPEHGFLHNGTFLTKAQLGQMLGRPPAVDAQELRQLQGQPVSEGESAKRFLRRELPRIGVERVGVTQDDVIAGLEEAKYELRQANWWPPRLVVFDVALEFARGTIEQVKERAVVANHTRPAFLRWALNDIVPRLEQAEYMIQAEDLRTACLWLKAVWGLTEGESPKVAFKQLKRCVEWWQGRNVEGAVLRRMCSRGLIRYVSIWKVNKTSAGAPLDIRAVLQIYFAPGGPDWETADGEVVRQEWMSCGHLAKVLARWRNVQGAPLYINGALSGKVGPDNPALIKIASNLAEDAASKRGIKRALASDYLAKGVRVHDNSGSSIDAWIKDGHPFINSLCYGEKVSEERRFAIGLSLLDAAVRQIAGKGYTSVGTGSQTSFVNERGQRWPLDDDDVNAISNLVYDSALLKVTAVSGKVRYANIRLPAPKLVAEDTQIKRTVHKAKAAGTAACWSYAELRAALTPTFTDMSGVYMWWSRGDDYAIGVRRTRDPKTAEVTNYELRHRPGAAAVHSWNELSRELVAYTDLHARLSQLMAFKIIGAETPKKFLGHLRSGQWSQEQLTDVLRRRGFKSGWGTTMVRSGRSSRYIVGRSADPEKALLRKELVNSNGSWRDPGVPHTLVPYTELPARLDRMGFRELGGVELVAEAESAKRFKQQLSAGQWSQEQLRKNLEPFGWKWRDMGCRGLEKKDGRYLYHIGNSTNPAKALVTRYRSYGDARWAHDAMVSVPYTELVQYARKPSLLVFESVTQPAVVESESAKKYMLLQRAREQRWADLKTELKQFGFKVHGQGSRLTKQRYNDVWSVAKPTPNSDRVLVYGRSLKGSRAAQEVPYSSAIGHLTAAGALAENVLSLEPGGGKVRLDDRPKAPKSIWTYQRKDAQGDPQPYHRVRQLPSGQTLDMWIAYHKDNAPRRLLRLVKTYGPEVGKAATSAADDLAHALQDRGITRVVPMPSAKPLAQRFARLLANRLKVPLNAVLAKTGSVHKIPISRRKAAAGALFQLVGEVKGDTVLLVDDYIVTAASQMAAATHLYQAGARQVYGAALAI